MRWMGVAAALMLGVAAPAQEKKSALPVREITVFKDGHAFVLAEGELETPGGVATLETLPQPVMGTFWPYATGGASLVSVTAGLKTVPGVRDVASLKELLIANIGKSVALKEHDNTAHAGLLQTVGDGLILLKSDSGLKALELSRIREATLSEGASIKVDAPTVQPRLSLKLSGAGEKAGVGVMYLQKGMRWIPGYKIDLDGKGQAKVKLQATLLNELTDLEKATVNLVIGVPGFAFKDTLDPMAIQSAIAQLSPYFDRNDSRTANRLAMSQSARMAERSYGPGSGASDEGAGGGDPEVSGSSENEDLFVFTVKNVSLKKGERMVLPVAEFSVPYRNVYSLELRPSPTKSASGYYDAAAAELARLASAPKARHLIRLTNTSPYPLTTGPALILKGGQVIAQGMSLFTAKGASSDIALTDAADISIKRSDKETERTPGALRADGYDYYKVGMKGTVELRNYRSEPLEIEVVRYVLGKVDSASQNGLISALDPLADDNVPDWLGGYGGFERIRFTGLGKIGWKATLPPGGKEGVTLDYRWHYFVR